MELLNTIVPVTIRLIEILYGPPPKNVLKADSPTFLNKFIGCPNSLFYELLALIQGLDTFLFYVVYFLEQGGQSFIQQLFQGPF